MRQQCTAQDIISLSEEKYIIAGARMFAREATKMFSDAFVGVNKKTICNTLRFFAEQARRDELEAFIYGIHTIVMERVGKAKTEYRPVRVQSEPSQKLVNPYEFLSADEQRYRALCRILLEGLWNAATTIGTMSGRDSKEVLAQLISDSENRTKNRDVKKEVEIILKIIDDSRKEESGLHG